MASRGRKKFNDNGTGELKHLAPEGAVRYENRFIRIERWDIEMRFAFAAHHALIAPSRGRYPVPCAAIWTLHNYAVIH
jgi:hypothetical protein